METSSLLLKRRVQALLNADDFDDRLEELHQYPARRIINPLISFLCSPSELLKWRAIAAMGIVVSHLADESLESARVIMRRLIWSLNDESGGIGWGAPEAMGEIMASHESMAREYVHILVSYIREDGNLLEHKLLERGVLWGIGRLAEVRPQLLLDFVASITPYLKSGDAESRGFAARALGLIGAKSAESGLQSLLSDQTEICLYSNGRLGVQRLSDLAAEALKRITG
jgi:HEAT repeat protein